MGQTNVISEHPALHSLFSELRRRKVFRVATIYVVLLWPLIQLADILQPVFGYSDAVIRILLYGFVAGFPFALALAWLYDLKRSGIVRTAAGAESELEQARPLLGRTTEALIIGALMLLVIALFVLKSTLFGDQSASAVERSTHGAADTAQSIAVLPFSSFSADENDQVFADGLTEELLNVLSRQSQLRVAARTSSFAYKGVSRNVQDIGRELGVTNILEGSVRRNDVSDTIRITAQLVDVATGAHLWSQTYDREYRDIFRIQDEIASAVAAQLNTTLLRAPETTSDHQSASNIDPEAFILISRGRAAMAKRTPSSIKSAESLLREGIARSPDWAEAQADYAQACVLMVLYAGADRDFLTRAQQAVTRALSLDPALGSAWAAQGLIHMQYDERRKQAVESLQKALSLNPSHAIAYMWLGSLQEDRAARLVYHRKALDLDPRSAIAANNVASDLLDVGDENQAMEVFNQIVTADPFYPGAYKLVARLNAMHGRLDDAILEYRRAYDLEADANDALIIGQLYLTLGDIPRGTEWLLTAQSGGAARFGGHAVDWANALLAQTQGDPHALARALRRVAESPESPVTGNFMSATAYTLLGEHAKAVQHFEAAETESERSGWTQFVDDHIDAYVWAAYSYQQLGRASDADRLLQLTRSHIEARLTTTGRINPAFWYQDARIHLLRGDALMGLTLLTRAVEGGWVESWRLLIDPIFGPLRTDERFRSLQRSLDARLRIMREELAKDPSN